MSVAVKLLLLYMMDENANAKLNGPEVSEAVVEVFPCAFYFSPREKSGDIGITAKSEPDRRLKSVCCAVLCCRPCSYFQGDQGV